MQEAEVNGGDRVFSLSGEGSVKSAKRKVETATVTTHVTTRSFDQDAAIAVPSKKCRLETSPDGGMDALRNEEDSGEVFTITTRHKEDYEVLLKVKSAVHNA